MENDAGAWHAFPQIASSLSDLDFAPALPPRWCMSIYTASPDKGKIYETTHVEGQGSAVADPIVEDRYSSIDGEITWMDIVSFSIIDLYLKSF